MTTIERVTLIAMAILAVIGLLSATATVAGNLLPPESKLGQALRRFGSDLRQQNPPALPPAATKDTEKEAPK